MKTIHTANALDGVKNALLSVAREIGSIPSYNRVIRIGSAIVILPDTDRTKDATPQEILKAMGIRNLVDGIPQEETLHKYTITDRTGDHEGIWGLTEEQHRLMQAILNQEFLFDNDTRIECLDSDAVKRI